MNRTILFGLLTLLVTGCGATIDSRTSSDPTQGGGGGEPRAREFPACVSCADALAGESGDICDDKIVDTLEVCSEVHCLDACDDNLFRTLSDKTRAAGCEACLAAKCGAKLAACLEN